MKVNPFHKMINTHTIWFAFLCSLLTTLMLLHANTTISSSSYIILIWLTYNQPSWYHITLFNVQCTCKTLITKYIKSLLPSKKYGSNFKHTIKKQILYRKVVSTCWKCSRFAIITFFFSSSHLLFQPKHSRQVNHDLCTHVYIYIYTSTRKYHPHPIIYTMYVV